MYRISKREIINSVLSSSNIEYSITEDELMMKEDYEKGLKYYYDHAYDKAIEYFDKYITLLKTNPYKNGFKEEMKEVEDIKKEAEIKLKSTKRYL